MWELRRTETAMAPVKCKKMILPLVRCRWRRLQLQEAPRSTPTGAMQSYGARIGFCIRDPAGALRFTNLVVSFWRRMWPDLPALSEAAAVSSWAPHMREPPPPGAS